MERVCFWKSADLVHICYIFIISGGDFFKCVLSVLGDTLMFLTSEWLLLGLQKESNVRRTECDREVFQHIVVSGWGAPEPRWRAWEPSVNICVCFARSAVACSVFCWWLKFVWKEGRADTQCSHASYKCNTQGVLLWFFKNTDVNNWEL